MNIFSPNKILKHLDRVQDYLERGITVPIMVDISLTDRCNHACPLCVGQRKNRKEMSVDQWWTVAQNLARSGVRSMKIAGGGEPTLYKDYIQMIKNTVGAGIDVGLVTNGTAITEKDAKELVKYCTWIRVSIDADGSERFKRVHGVDLWDKTVVATKMIADYKGKCTVGVGVLVGPHDLGWLAGAAKEISTWGVDYVQFRPFNNTQADIRKELEEAKKYETGDFKVLHSIHRLENDFKRDYNICHAKYFIPGIATDGTVYPCCYLRGIDKYQVGDLKKDSLAQIIDKMDKAYFDFKNCPILCRGDVMNLFIESAKAPMNHETFV